MLGFFNVCNKVVISLDIMVEFREYFKGGFPLTNLITRKLNALMQKAEVGLYLK